jgi:hypothetical protein
VEIGMRMLDSQSSIGILEMMGAEPDEGGDQQ